LQLAINLGHGRHCDRLHYGLQIWRHQQLLKLQDTCLIAELPTDRPMWDFDEQMSESGPKSKSMATRQPFRAFMRSEARDHGTQRTLRQPKIKTRRALTRDASDFV